MVIRQTVRKTTKETSRLKVNEIRDSKIDFVIILRDTEGEPKRRLAPSRDLVTEREVVGDER